jgi:hypothetical protein
MDIKALVGSSLGISCEACGSGALHAAFLKESRIRGRVQCSVQEIRVAPSFSSQVRWCEPGAPVRFEHRSSVRSKAPFMQDPGRRSHRLIECRGNRHAIQVFPGSKPLQIDNVNHSALPSRRWKQKTMEFIVTRNGWLHHPALRIATGNWALEPPAMYS